jgi:hypothetical protein
VTASVDPSGAYFAWRHYHPRESEDPSAVWGAAWRAGGRAAITASSELADLVPVLRGLLETLEDGYIEAEVRASDQRPGWQDHDEVGECECDPPCAWVQP